jgi:DNA-binding MarR family transcriptional regulator
LITTVETRRAKDSRDAVASRLRLTIARLARRLRQEAMAGLSPSLLSALATIQAHGPLTPSELAARERLARPGVTRIISRLEHELLVTSTPDPFDGRSYTVEVTPRGVALLRDARQRSKAFLSRALRALEEEELATLAAAAALLDRLLEDEQ